MNYKHKKFDLKFVKKQFLYEEVEFQTNEYLFHEGNENSFVYYIIDGKIKVIKKKIVIGFSNPNEFVGITSCLSENNEYCFSALAQENSTLLRIHKTVFKTVLNENVEFGKIIIDLLCNRIKLTDGKSESFKNHTSTERVVNEILSNVETENNSYTIKATIEDLSELTGVSTNLIKTIIRELSKQKIIEFINHTIRISDYHRLELIGRIN
jgi:CRP/FNR family cyclic AMP-dependent transcriptional regulator